MKTTMMVFACVLAASACGKGGGGGGGGGAAAALYAQNNAPDNLKGLVDTILKASESGNVKTAAALTRSLIVDEAAAKKVVKDDAPGDFVKSYVANAAKIPPDDEQIAGLFKRGEADRTQINVHGATTEEIAAYADGSVAFAEFPGGARRLARAVLRPGVKFYEVELVKPGENLGVKYHLFYWDGARWRMLGPAWRQLPPE